VWNGSVGSGVVFRAGAGVGTVTRPGLPIPPGEPAINPVPRAMIRAAVAEAAAAVGRAADVVVEISIPDGQALARKTLNPRLGIVGGLSILGTTGIVIPYSCAAWIHGITQGIDVARAAGLTHIAGATGRTSETAVAQLYRLPEIALIDMGDFAGGMLKYLSRHPIARVTIAGGFAKISKLAQGRLDLHSRRGAIDLGRLTRWLTDLGADAATLAAAESANTAQQILSLSRQQNIPLAQHIAGHALATANRTLSGTGIAVDVVIFDRDGCLAGRSAVETA
ncbi:MAG: cobalt-precorrin-5B (C(1))-methyltransferase, partial [Hyphomicrobiaceae bacterium]